MSNIICVDIETTGTNKKIDSIIQISAVRIVLNDDNSISYTGEEFNSYINPGPNAHWTKQAIEKTGLTPEFLMHAPSPEKVLKSFHEWVKDDDNILTYNGNSFDIPFIKKAMREVGLSFNIAGRKCYDSLYIETVLNSRKLEEVYKRYNGGRTMEEDGLDAHNSLSDVKATVSVFEKQIGIVTKNNIAIETDNTGGGMIGRDDTNQMVFLVGKHKGELIKEVIKEDPSYVTWFIKDAADPDIFAAIKAEYTALKNSSNQ